jgi:hypothetical protein
LAWLLLAAGVEASAEELRPNLVTVDKGTVRICQEAPDSSARRDACHGTGTTVLRTSTFLGNTGRGPLEFVPDPSAPLSGCPSDVPPAEEVMVAQRIYQDVNGDGVYKRSIDTSYAQQIVGCRFYHPAHKHYHLDGYAQLQLRSDATGQIVRSGNKISFCIDDTARFKSSLPGSPSNPYYLDATCQDRLSVQGTSVGWYDLYGWDLPGQQIDITGIPPGSYCLIVTVDPFNTLGETNETDNSRNFHVYIDPSRAPVNSYTALSRAHGACPA